MVNDMLGYVLTVPGIGVDTGLFVVWTKRMPGPDRFDPPGSYCQWQESIECRSHPFGFDWKTYRDEQRKIRNAKDTPDNAKFERPPRFQKLYHAEVNFGEYLWSSSKRQLADERADRGWRIQQIQPAQVQDSMVSTTEQVVEISPGVYVVYPTR